MSMDPVETFRVEAAELLEQIEQGLLDLTHRLTDKDLIDAVFRSLHTLKGSGSMFGFDALAAFTHHCETAFDRVRKGEVPATAELVSAVLSARDHMRSLVEEEVTPDHVATGDVLLDQLPLMLRAGFSTFEITNAATIRALEAAPLPAVSRVYQAGAEVADHGWRPRRGSARSPSGPSREL